MCCFHWKLDQFSRVNVVAATIPARTVIIVARVANDIRPISDDLSDILSDPGPKNSPSAKFARQCEPPGGLITLFCATVDDLPALGQFVGPVAGRLAVSESRCTNAGAGPDVQVARLPRSDAIGGRHCRPQHDSSGLRRSRGPRHHDAGSYRGPGLRNGAPLGRRGVVGVPDLLCFRMGCAATQRPALDAPMELRS